MQWKSAITALAIGLSLTIGGAAFAADATSNTTTTEKPTGQKMTNSTTSDPSSGKSVSSSSSTNPTTGESSGSTTAQ